MTYPIFDQFGKFCPMPESDRDQLSPPELAAYLATLDAAAKCEASEQLVASLETALADKTAEIRGLETRLARFPKPDRIALVRHVLMHDGR